MNSAKVSHHPHTPHETSCTDGTASAYPLEPPPPYTELPCVYPAPAWLQSGARFPGYQVPPTELNLSGNQPPSNHPWQLHQSAPVAFVVRAQPGNMVVHQAFQECTIPADHWNLSWFACLCCFWPLGIVAVQKSKQVHMYLARGDFNSARIASSSARKFAWAAICIGITIFVICFACVILFTQTCCS